MEDGVKDGWNGVYCFPRVFWLDNGELRMAPAQELDRLCYNKQEFEIGALDGMKMLNLTNPELFRIKAKIKVGSASKIGFRLRASDKNEEFTDIYYDVKAKKLVFDSEKSSLTCYSAKEEAPFELKDGENLELDIFADKAVIEVYANEKQAIGRRIYPTLPDSLNVAAFSDGAEFCDTVAWEVSPTNLY